MILQTLFTTHASDNLTVEDYLDIGLKNKTICNTLGFRGRLFVVEAEHLNIIEGPAPLVTDYCEAFLADPRVSATVKHYARELPAPEFPDYSIWVNHGGVVGELPEGLNPLALDTVQDALVPGLSAKVRLMIEGYITAKL